MIDRTSENIVRLAHEVLDSWDNDTLESYALDHLEHGYAQDDESFQEDWSSTIKDDNNG